MIQCIEGAQVQLHYAGNKKLETRSGGITVTGALTATTEINAGRMTLSDDGQGSPTLMIRTDDENPWRQEMKVLNYSSPMQVLFISKLGGHLLEVV